MSNTPLSYRAIGLMSGSSLDGLDFCHGEFTYKPSAKKSNPWCFELLHAKTADLGIWTNKLREAVNIKEDDLSKLSKEFAKFLADETKLFVQENKLENIDLIASHGHTIFHYPNQGRTCQLGDGQILANELGITVVNNLRQQDIDVGGQGAPIVPIGDKYLFADYPVCLNIGGIANISIKVKESILAFDICAANQVLNYYAIKLGKPYDDKGLWARQGLLNQNLLDALNQEKYYTIKFPKSLDNSFSKKLILLIDEMEKDERNALCTYVEHISVQLARSINLIGEQYGLSLSKNIEMLITGGGAFNDFLIERIQANLNIQTVIPAKELIEYKEALIMGFIGVLRIREEVNVLASVTGASRDSSCGDIYQAI